MKPRKDVTEITEKSLEVLQKFIEQAMTLTVLTKNTVSVEVAYQSFAGTFFMLGYEVRRIQDATGKPVVSILEDILVDRETT